MSVALQCASSCPNRRPLPSLHCLRNGLESFQGTAAAVTDRGLFYSAFLVEGSRSAALSLLRAIAARIDPALDDRALDHHQSR